MATPYREPAVAPRVPFEGIRSPFRRATAPPPDLTTAEAWSEPVPSGSDRLVGSAPTDEGAAYASRWTAGVAWAAGIALWALLAGSIWALVRMVR